MSFNLLISQHSACATGYEGVFCQNRKSVCDPNPCLNSGICYEATTGQAACVCQNGTFGNFCETLLKGILINCSFLAEVKKIKIFNYLKLVIHGRVYTVPVQMFR